MTGNDPLYAPIHGGDGFKIFSLNFRRPKYKCLKGFGLCEFVVLGIKVVDMDNVLERERRKKDIYYAPLRVNKANNERYFNFYLSKSPETEGIELSEMPPLTVDEMLETEFKNDSTTERYTILPGEYRYDPTLGEFGGFKVVVR